MNTTGDNITINIKATNLELTNEIRDYIEKKVTKFGKLLTEEPDSVFVYFEVAKTTTGQQNGDIYRADCNVEFSGKKFYAASETADILNSIDDVKQKLFREIRKNKNKSTSLIRRGHAKLKRMMKRGK